MNASEHSIQIYALIIADELIHLILAYETPILSASWNMCNIKIAYYTMLRYLEKLNSTKTMLANLNNKRARLLCCETRREISVPSSFLLIVTMLQKRK
ncbi:unnamed protein product [Rhizophagus irregularis]|nr:unnamed protein product [Rhizophagus irregularis]